MHAAPTARVGAAAVSAALALLVAAGCSPQRTPGVASRFATTAAAPLPATSPYLVMTGPMTGWAVWPSGPAWLALYTTDGFRHVSNRTPVAVETNGGLVGTFLRDRVAIAVGAHDRLVRSPVLSGSVTTSVASWTPAELPGAVSDSRRAVALRGSTVTVVTSASAGTVLAETSNGWRAVTDVRSLDTGSMLHIDGVTWANSRQGWITGHGASGAAMAFQTTTGGRSWTPVTRSADGQIAALAPCRAGREWLLPIIGADATLRVLRTVDDGRTWSAGTRLRVAGGQPAWGCAANEVWMAGRSGTTDHVFSSADFGASWVDEGPAPASLTDLAPSGGGAGFAASAGKHTTLWSVTGNGARFAAIALPGWVASVGAQMSTS